jgi:hypothetical protein
VGSETVPPTTAHLWGVASSFTFNPGGEKQDRSIGKRRRRCKKPKYRVVLLQLRACAILVCAGKQICLCKSTNAFAEGDDVGGCRISVGGSLAHTAWAGFMRAAKEIAEQGTFTELAKGYPGVELNKMFR